MSFISNLPLPPSALRSKPKLHQEGMNRNAYGDARHETQVRMHFRQWDKVFDLSNFKITRTDEDLFKDGQTMMNVQQLVSNRRLAVNDHNRDIRMNERFMSTYITTLQPAPKHDTLMKALAAVPAATAIGSSFLDRVPVEKRPETAANALSSTRNLLSQFGFKAEQEESYQSRLRKFDVEFHQKFTLSFGCLLLFLIGAPLGSIIRKGGIGLPLIFAILFFLVYHLMSISGRKLALAGKLDPAVGMWMSTAFLLPIALVLIQQARNDSQLFAKETYMRLLAKLRFGAKRGRREGEV